MDIKERFCQKIHEELLLYQKSNHKQSSRDNSKSEIIDKLYNILLFAADELSEALLSNLINQSVNILESLYDNFVTKASDDTMYNELENFVMQEFEEYEDGDCDWWNNPAYMEGA